MEAKNLSNGRTLTTTMFEQNFRSKILPQLTPIQHTAILSALAVSVRFNTIVLGLGLMEDETARKMNVGLLSIPVQWLPQCYGVAL